MTVQSPKAKSRKGNPRAFHKEFEETALAHLNAMYALAMHLTHNKADAEDLVQETVIKAYRAFKNFEQGTHIKAWLFTILRNTFINEYRRRKKSPVQPAQEGDPEFSFYATAFEQKQKNPDNVRIEDLQDASKL
ncbi:MAG: sigma-70 family RNA polymerase sigma factor, partial [Candidatus Omnitrophica bacterium]|nr:sigma-70 family RNA polymerase sigma factor [Candidatus Omnitrophota bacterium]